MTPSSYRSYLELADSADMATMESRLNCLAQAQGFPLSNATCVVSDPGGVRHSVRSVRTAPEAAREMIGDATSFRRDPCVLLAKATVRPFFYDQAFYVRQGAGDLWEEQAVYGYNTGINAVLHLGTDRHFVLGMDRPEALPTDPDVLMRMLADLQLLATFVQDTAMRLLINERTPESTPPSARELEVLKWAAAGKTAWETGMILSISDSTVNKHISAAMRRMGCSSKAHAIARAFSLRLL